MEKDHHLESHYIRVCPLSPSQGFCGNLGWDPHIQAPGLFRSHRAWISPMTVRHCQPTRWTQQLDILEALQPVPCPTPCSFSSASFWGKGLGAAQQELFQIHLEDVPPPTCFQSRKARSIWGNVKETRVSELLRGNNLSAEDRQENHQSWGVFTPMIPFPLGFLIASVLPSLPLPPLLDPLF